jgi:cysteine-rich repeat protein
LLLPRAVLAARLGCRAVLAFAVALAAASRADAERLLVPVAGAHALPAGVARGRALALGRSALADLHGRPRAVVSEFPIGVDGSVELHLTRFDPFLPGARIEVVDGGGVRAVPLPDETYFVGTVGTDTTSRALVIAGRDHVRGFVATAGTLYAFGPDGRGHHRTYALRDADPSRWPPPGDFCADDLVPARVGSPLVDVAARVAAGLVPPPVALAADTVLREADVAIETDHELWTRLGSDQATLAYLASLAAADSGIYERDLGVRLRFSYVRLWASAADPWSATTTSDQLDEVQAYWTNPANDMDAIAGPHDLVHFVSGKSVEGGIAYIGSVCAPTYAFGVSQVFGSFDLSSPSAIWDVLVTAHEIGHNLGSPHTHCYNPPVDRCYDQEPGCYSGPVVASRGTIMSYCHLLAGGLSNIDLVFGDVVSTRIRNTVATSCLRPVTGCGNGVLDPNEECDDGNTVSGDGCSATCRREPRCGDGVLDPGEECDDGNTVSGDGCSAACRRERCTVRTLRQAVWARSHLLVRRGARGHDRLNLHAEFGLAMPFDGLAPAVTGIVLAVDPGAGATELEIDVPPGPRWVAGRGRWTYDDPHGAVAGIRRVDLRDATRGGVPAVAVSLTGRGGSYPVSAAELPFAVTVVVGDGASGVAGACGRRTFDAATCTSARAGARLACR